MRQMALADRWQIGALGVAAVVAVPVLVILSSFFQPVLDIWSHLIETVLPELFVNTVYLAVGVGTGTLVLGTGLGWLTGACDFPGRRFFSVALLLPMAIPTYVFAFVYLGLLDFSGPVQGALRQWFGMAPIEVRNPVGVCVVMTLALYPYVYLMARTGFRLQGKRALEAARTLGIGPMAAFRRVALPMCRPWLVAGLMLVFMETLADFGAVSIFNFNTFTTAIYKSWYGFFSLTTAAQLASILVIIVMAVLVAEQRMRQRMRYTQDGAVATRVQLTGRARVGAVALCGGMFLMAFILPCVQLILWTLEIFAEEFGPRYVEQASTTLLLGLLAASVTVFCAVVLSYAKRRSSSLVVLWATRIATMGYALPGTVLAVGVFLPTAWADNAIIAFSKLLNLGDPGPLLQGTVIVMVLAYMVRFMAAGFGSVDSAMQRITPSIDESARLMGVQGFALLKRIHLPMLRSGILTGCVLVLVDVMKEMPITLMTRPFGWDTLAVKIYELTSEGEWERAALPAIGLVLVGLLPVGLLTLKSGSEAGE